MCADTGVRVRETGDGGAGGLVSNARRCAASQLAFNQSQFIEYVRHVRRSPIISIMHGTLANYPLMCVYGCPSNSETEKQPKEKHPAKTD